MFFYPFIFKHFMSVCCVSVNNMLLDVIPFPSQNQIPEEGLRKFNSRCVCIVKPESALWLFCLWTHIFPAPPSSRILAPGFVWLIGAEL